MVCGTKIQNITSKETDENDIAMSYPPETKYYNRSTDWGIDITTSLTMELEKLFTQCYWYEIIDQEHTD
jgi:hypothetical protein